jgi:hypothetical protein
MRDGESPGHPFSCSDRRILDIHHNRFQLSEQEDNKDSEPGPTPATPQQPGRRPCRVSGPSNRWAKDRVTHSECIARTEKTVGEGVEQEGTPVRRVVQKGDNLSRLAEDIYGFSDQVVLNRVKQQNSHIKDQNIILPGEMIVFPALEE